MTAALKAKTGIAMDVVPWVDAASMTKPTSSAAWACTLSDKFEDVGAAFRHASFQVRHMACYSLAIFFVRIAGRNPVMLFTDMRSTKFDEAFIKRTRTIETSAAAAAKSNWLASEQFFRIQGLKAELEKIAAIPNLQSAPVKNGPFAPELEQLDICCDQATAEAVSKHDVTMFPHAALLSSTAADLTIQLRMKYDKVNRRGMSLGDTWAITKFLTQAGCPSIIRKGGIIIALKPARWTTSEVEILQKKPGVEKIIPNVRLVPDAAVGAAAGAPPVAEESSELDNLKIPVTVTRKHCVVITSGVAVGRSTFNEFCVRTKGKLVISNFCICVVDYGKPVVGELLASVQAAAGASFDVGPLQAAAASV